MKKFKTYLLEIFNQNKTESEDHPDLLKDQNEDDTSTDKNKFVYSHIPKDENGNPMKDREIRTWMLKNKEGDWETSFTVGGTNVTKQEKEFPADVTERVFGHLKHFVDTVKKNSGNPPTIRYETPNKKKHRIYQAVARRLGVKATNMEIL
jgi:hypothetical protein